MSHQSKVPTVAAEYFARAGITTHPIIVEIFGDGRGWQRFPYRARVSYSQIRKLRQGGISMVTLAAGGRRVDFSVRELSQQTGTTLKDWAPFFQALAERVAN